MLRSTHDQLIHARPASPPKVLVVALVGTIGADA